MPGNGDGEIDIGVLELAGGWVVFRPGITPTTDMGRVPVALSEIMSDWLKGHPTLQVRAALPIVQDGNTVAIHLWFAERLE